MKNLFVYSLYMQYKGYTALLFGQRCAPQVVQQYQFCIDIRKKQNKNMTIILM